MDVSEKHTKQVQDKAPPLIRTALYIALTLASCFGQITDKETKPCTMTKVIQSMLEVYSLYLEKK